MNLDDWFFHCHFDSDPVQPGCLGVDGIWQLLGFYCIWRGGLGSGRALGCGEVDFAGQIRPHDELIRYEVDVRRYTEIKHAGASLVVGDARLLIDGEEIYTIKQAKVGLFREIKYRRLSAAIGKLTRGKDGAMSDAPIALVTGGATGIGAACARSLAGDGFRIALHYRSSEEKALKILAELPESFGVRADLSDSAAIDGLVKGLKEKVGRVDVLVNNAGYNENAPILAMKLDSYDAVAGLARGTWYLTKLVLRRFMLRQGHGSGSSTSRAWSATRETPARSPTRW